MVPWHLLPPVVATSVTCTCLEQQSFRKPPTVCKPCAEGCHGGYSQPPTLGELSLGKGSLVIRLADGATRRLGRALNGEPRGWNSPWQATGNQRKDFEHAGNSNSAFHFSGTCSVPGALLSSSRCHFIKFSFSRYSYQLHSADEKTGSGVVSDLLSIVQALNGSIQDAQLSLYCPELSSGNDFQGLQARLVYREKVAGRVGISDHR